MPDDIGLAPERLDTAERYLIDLFPANPGGVDPDRRVRPHSAKLLRVLFNQLSNMS